MPACSQNYLVATNDDIQTEYTIYVGVGVGIQVELPEFRNAYDTIECE